MTRPSFDKGGLLRCIKDSFEDIGKNIGAIIENGFSAEDLLVFLEDDEIGQRLINGIAMSIYDKVNDESIKKAVSLLFKVLQDETSQSFQSVTSPTFSEILNSEELSDTKKEL